ncbi:MAG: hypothetical protein RLZZ74_3455 [Cyanobacteriota bacterium]|jgi:hypothetical protein
MLYHIFKSRYVYGGSFPGSRLSVGAYERIEDVEAFLKLKKALYGNFETRYETKPDEMGCYDLYIIEVEL